MNGALLFVLSEPGEKVTVDEFHDWYNNEHVPLRMNNDLPEFLTGTRYESLLPNAPRWGAIYEVSDASFFQDPRYTKLRANRSPREASLVSNLQILDRRTYGEKLYDSGSVKDEKGPAPLILTVCLTPKEGTDEDFNKWYSEEHLEMFAKVPGWRRAYRYKLTDSLLSQTGKEPQSGKAPAYIAVYEFDQLFDPQQITESDACKKSTSTPWAKKHMEGAQASELTFWKLYRDWPNTAHVAKQI